MDYDLLSLQEARILAENAAYAHKWVKGHTQDQLDAIVNQTVGFVEPHIETFCKMAIEETKEGVLEDKISLAHYVMRQIKRHFEGLKCLGIIKEDLQEKTKEIGVPYGVVLASVSESNVVATTLYYVLCAIKSGNALIVASPQKVKNTFSKIMDCMIEAAEKSGLPKGILSYYKNASPEGFSALMAHPNTQFVLLDGESNSAYKNVFIEKPFVFSTDGHGPCFIERTADIEKAVSDIILSKAFDHGLLMGSENALVVDAPVHEAVLKAFKERGCYVLSDEEREKIAGILQEAIAGKSAHTIAKMAGIDVPKSTKLLIALQSYVPENDPFSIALKCPILPYYIESNWQNACEKCIELLFADEKGHTLTIHTTDECVVEQFALKKPVGRVLVNTPAGFGSVGATTNLMPSVSLGSGSTGKGIVSENVSPLHWVYKRKVGYGVRDFLTSQKKEALEPWIKKIIEEVLSK